MINNKYIKAFNEACEKLQNLNEASEGIYYITFWHDEDSDTVGVVHFDNKEAYDKFYDFLTNKLHYEILNTGTLEVIHDADAEIAKWMDEYGFDESAKLTEDQYSANKLRSHRNVFGSPQERKRIADDYKEKFGITGPLIGIMNKLADSPSYLRGMNNWKQRMAKEGRWDDSELTRMGRDVLEDVRDRNALDCFYRAKAFNGLDKETDPIAMTKIIYKVLGTDN